MVKVRMHANLKQMLRQTALQASLLVGLAMGLSSAYATEGSLTRVLPGLPGQDLTLPLTPGWYATVNQLHYSADHYNDNSGNTPVVPIPNTPFTANANIKYKTDVTAFIIVRKSEMQFAGGDVSMLVVVPYISGKLTTNLAGNFPPVGLTPAQLAQLNGGLALKSAALSGSGGGLGDIQFSPYLDWQRDQSRTIAGVDIIAPTGNYNSNNAFNPGYGKYWSYRPTVAYAYAFESGIDVAIKADYTVNTRNTATQIKSGQYVHADWVALYRVNDDYKVGLHGYAIKQVTDDDGPTVASNGNRLQVYAAGPGISYLAPNLGWGLEAKWMKEFAVRNRPEGSALWLRGQFRFE